jgi:hypothetical protein
MRSILAVCLVLFPLAASGDPLTPVLRSPPPESVRLLDGPFKDAQDRDAAWLLSLDPDRLAARFRSEAGLTPRAPGYGGWEADTIGGHTMGHYLSACARMYAATGDARFRERVARLVDDLAECQEANTKAGLAGYVAAIPGGKRAFAEVKAGEIRSKGFDLNGIWVPWYTLHKEMAGLRDAHRYCGNAKALEVWRGLADFSYGVVKGLDGAQLNRMLRCEQGGMNEVAADLYAITRDPAHLDLALRFCDKQVLDPLAEGRDILPGLHANTQVPKVIGAARLYELTGEERFLRSAEYFWSFVAKDHSYANGGNSLNEYFGPRRVIAGRLAGNTTETCNTYNMLKLTRHLEGWAGPWGLTPPGSRAGYPKLDLVGYAERALYSHILPSQDPGSAGVLYFTQLRPGSRKDFQSLDTDFTCCVGSGMENHASYGDHIYSLVAAPAEGGLPARTEVHVDLFIASELRLPSMTLRQETRFPDEPATTLRVTGEEPSRVQIRRPAWAKSVRCSLNGGPLRPVEPSGPYFPADLPAGGGAVRIEFDIPVRAEPAPDDPTLVALLYGPVLLAADLGEKEPAPGDMPVIVSAEGAAADAWLARQEGAGLAFRTGPDVRPRSVPVVPFFRIARQHYAVYWRRLTPEGWELEAARLRAAEERRRALEAATVDFVQPGEMQPERDHDFQGDRTNHGEHRGLRWRDAYRGGWFSFRMKGTGDATPLRLVCTYWGDDTGDREFDILVDDVKVATQVLDRNKPGEFFDVAYDLPAEVTKGKGAFRVKFGSTNPKTAGGVFGVRIVRTETRP